MLSVLIAGPVRKPSAILKEFLWSLDILDKTNLSVSYAFVDDNNDLESKELLKQFALNKDNIDIIPANADDFYHCDETTHHWQEHLIWKVAAYKDNLLKLASEKNFDYVFMVDSDLILHPKTLVHLVGLSKDIVSEVFWTKWEPDLPPQPQVWLSDSYRMFHSTRNEK
ncbi:hypothetical protein N752_21805 [Desulforamulus aquiferis]|nr:hypothetical protein [Desulforamulus aquiferis]RYD03049.1 hypothetical protein N752_21805 [Desulforamulus aquiferis]